MVFGLGKKKERAKEVVAEEKNGDGLAYTNMKNEKDEEDEGRERLGQVVVNRLGSALAKTGSILVSVLSCIFVQCVYTL